MKCQTILLKWFFGLKGAVYSEAIAMYFHMWRFQVFARKLSWYIFHWCLYNKYIYIYFFFFLLQINHTEVMDIYVFLELYDEVFQMWALSRMKSWILYRLRSAQKYPHFEGFSIDQTGWLKFRIFYHIWTHFGIIYVYNLPKATICWALSRALYTEAIA